MASANPIDVTFAIRFILTLQVQPGSTLTLCSRSARLLVFAVRPENDSGPSRLIPTAWLPHWRALDGSSPGVPGAESIDERSVKHAEIVCKSFASSLVALRVSTTS